MSDVRLLYRAGNTYLSAELETLREEFASCAYNEGMYIECRAAAADD
jgi:hypothetical protein